MFEFSVALRFLKEGRLQTLLIVIGIAVGIAVQIFLSALIGGLQKDLIQKTVGNTPHITGISQEYIPISFLPNSIKAGSRIVSSSKRDRPLWSWEPIILQLSKSGLFTVVTPVAEGAGFIFRGEKSLPVIIRGVNLASVDSIYNITGRIIDGRKDLRPGTIFIGSELAAQLRIRPGSTIRLTTAEGISDRFTVEGIFDLQSKVLNETWVIMPLVRSQALLDIDNGISVIEMQVPHVFDAAKATILLRERFNEISWTSWMEKNAQLLTALKSQSSSSDMIQILVLIAVTLGIASVLAVSAIQKSRQIGILKAIGATGATIGRIFLIQGAILGFLGSLIGCFAGYGLVTGFLIGTAKATGIPLFPLAIDPSLYVISIAIATTAGTIAAFIPARRSSKLNPIEVIRNG